MVAEQIALLKELQSYDLKILALKNRIDSLPLGVKQSREKIEKESKGLEERKKEIQAAELARRKLELELREKEEDLQKFQLQLNEAKTNKEYSTLLQQIKELKETNSQRESRILEMMDGQDALHQQEKKELSLLKEENERLAEEEEKVAAEIETLKSQLKEQEDKRKLLSANVNNADLSLYEKIGGSKKNNLAIAEIKGETCSGCFMKLPSSVVENVRKGKEFVLCENCSRILYLSEK
ncbi:MAG: hypothetical protein KAX20_01000 [Candidatus Omnitrophica bacterium]|nr:hypothetical protein [Candidatus Omnitrophota bacterium]